jgi:predicted transposase YbfD/YdcC
MPYTAKKTLELATGQGSQVMVQVKANQPALFAAVQQAEARVAPYSQACQFDHARSRMEWRTVTVFDAAAVLTALPEPTEWSELISAVVQVHRKTDCFDTRTGHWKVRTETAYYVATALQPAEVFAKVIRGHWGIENRHHYVRDVTLQEDASRIRRNPGIFARLRSFTLNILRKNNITNVSEALYDNALCLDNLRDYVGVF